MDHARAFGDAGQGELLAVDYPLHQRGLGPGVGGHDGPGRLAQAVRVQPGHQPGQGLGDPVPAAAAAPMTPVDDGQHQTFRDMEQLGRRPGWWPGRLQTLGAGAGVGVAGVHQDGLGFAVPQAVLGEHDRRRLDPVGGEDPGRGGGVVRHQQGQVQGAGLFEAAAVAAK